MCLVQPLPTIQLSSRRSHLRQTYKQIRIQGLSTHWYFVSLSKELSYGSFLGLNIQNGEQSPTQLKESKDLSSLALDELIGNLKVHEVVMKKDSKIYRGKKERVKSIALKDKKESSNDELRPSRSDDEDIRFIWSYAVIQIISLAIVQNHLATKIKRLSLEFLEAIARMTPKTKKTNCFSKLKWASTRGFLLLEGLSAAIED
ncbi:hypothetical protein Tco_1008353 [Tanacetum coccineum]